MNLGYAYFYLYSFTYSEYLFQIDLYNKMVEKKGMEGEAEAKKAYRAAREDSDHAAEMAVGGKVSSALINRVSRL